MSVYSPHNAKGHEPATPSSSFSPHVHSAQQDDSVNPPTPEDHPRASSTPVSAPSPSSSSLPSVVEGATQHNGGFLVEASPAHFTDPHALSPLIGTCPAPPLPPARRPTSPTSSHRQHSHRPSKLHRRVSRTPSSSSPSGGVRLTIAHDSPRRGEEEGEEQGGSGPLLSVGSSAWPIPIVSRSARRATAVEFLRQGTESLDVPSAFVFASYSKHATGAVGDEEVSVSRVARGMDRRPPRAAKTASSRASTRRRYKTTAAGSSSTVRRPVSPSKPSARYENVLQAAYHKHHNAASLISYGASRRRGSRRADVLDNDGSDTAQSEEKARDGVAEAASSGTALDSFGNVEYTPLFPESMHSARLVRDQNGAVVTGYPLGGVSSSAGVDRGDGRGPSNQGGGGSGGTGGGGGGDGMPTAHSGSTMIDVPWVLRDAQEDATCASLAFLSSRQFWFCVQYAARVAFIAILIPAALVNAALPYSPFWSASFALSSAVMGTAPSVGESTMFFVQYLKAGFVWLPLATASVALRLNRFLGAWFVVYTFVLFLMATFTEQHTRRSCLMLFNISMVSLLSGNTHLYMPVRVLCDWLLGAAFALAAALMPYPLLATTDCTRIARRLFRNSATCFTGILSCFWSRSPIERSMSMVRVRHLLRVMDHLVDEFNRKDAFTFYEQLVFGSTERREVRKEKVLLLLKLKMNLREMERVIHLVQERPQIMDRNRRSLLFREHLVEPVAGIARSMETLLFAVSQANTYDELRDLSPEFEETGKNVKRLQDDFDTARRVLFYEYCPAGMDEYVPLMMFFVFSVVNFWSTLREFEAFVQTRPPISAWRSSLLVLVKSTTDAFRENWQLIVRLCTRPAEPELRVVLEAAKVSVAMLIAMLFFYYVNDQELLLSGPTVIATVSGANPVEAVQASAARLTGTLLGSVIGFFAVSLCHNAVDRVAALCTIAFIMFFFRTVPHLGIIVMYCTFMAVPNLSPGEHSGEDAISRIQQNTFAIFIYCIISVVVFPVSPEKVLLKKRLAVVTGLSQATQRMLALFGETGARRRRADSPRRARTRFGGGRDAADGDVDGESMGRGRGGDGATQPSTRLFMSGDMSSDSNNAVALTGAPSGAFAGLAGAHTNASLLLPRAFTEAPKDVVVDDLLRELTSVLTTMQSTSSLVLLAAEEFTVLPRDYPLRASGDVHNALNRLCVLVYSMVCCWKLMREKAYFSEDMLHVFANLAPVATDLELCLDRFVHVLTFYVEHPSAGLSSELTKAVSQFRGLCAEFTMRKNHNFLAVVHKTVFERRERHNASQQANSFSSDASFSPPRSSSAKRGTPRGKPPFSPGAPSKAVPGPLWTPVAAADATPSNAQPFASGNTASAAGYRYNVTNAFGGAGSDGDGGDDDDGVKRGATEQSCESELPHPCRRTERVADGTTVAASTAAPADATRRASPRNSSGVSGGESVAHPVHGPANSTFASVPVLNGTRVFSSLFAPSSPLHAHPDSTTEPFAAGKAVEEGRRAEGQAAQNANSGLRTEEPVVRQSGERVGASEPAAAAEQEKEGGQQVDRHGAAHGKTASSLPTTLPNRPPLGGDLGSLHERDTQSSFSPSQMLRSRTYSATVVRRENLLRARARRTTRFVPQSSYLSMKSRQPPHHHHHHRGNGYGHTVHHGNNHSAYRHPRHAHHTHHRKHQTLSMQAIASAAALSPGGEAVRMSLLSSSLEGTGAVQRGNPRAMSVPRSLDALASLPFDSPNTTDEALERHSPQRQTFLHRPSSLLLGPHKRRASRLTQKALRASQDGAAALDGGNDEDRRGGGTEGLPRRGSWFSPLGHGTAPAASHAPYDSEDNAVARDRANDAAKRTAVPLRSGEAAVALSIAHGTPSSLRPSHSSVDFTASSSSSSSAFSVPSSSSAHFSANFATPVTVLDAEGLHSFALILEALGKELLRLLFGLEEMIQSL